MKEILTIKLITSNIQLLSSDYLGEETSQRYVDDGGYHRFLRNISKPYLRYFHKEEVFFKDRIGPGSTVLDVGCGEGRLTVPLAVHVGPDGKVVGIDFKERMYEDTKKKVAVLRNAEVYMMDARNLDQLRDSFDYVLFPFDFIGLVEHEDQVPLLRKARTKLKDGGEILATVFSEMAAPDQMMTYQRLWDPSTIRVDSDYVYVDAIDYKAERFSQEKITKLFTDAGLEPTVGKLTKMAYWIRAE